MKLLKILILAAIVGAMSTAVRADGVTDPEIKLGPSGNSTPTMDGATAEDPIFVADDTGQNDFFLDNPAIAADGVVYFEVVPFQGEPLSQFLNESWQCVAELPVATGCGLLPGLQGLESNAVNQGFTWTLSCSGFDPNGNPITVACPGLEAVFTGAFTVGEDVGLTVPEPSALLFLLVGLPIALLAGMKKRNEAPIPA